MTSPLPGPPTDRDLPHDELSSAEQRGEERVRAQVRDVLDEARRIVRLGEHQIEVVEVAALLPLLEDDAG